MTESTTTCAISITLFLFSKLQYHFWTNVCQHSVILDPQDMIFLNPKLPDLYLLSCLCKCCQECNCIKLPWNYVVAYKELFRGRTVVHGVPSISYANLMLDTPAKQVLHFVTVCRCHDNILLLFLYFCNCTLKLGHTE